MDADLFLIHRMRNGDEAAIEAFVRNHYPTILHYCYYRTSDRNQAEDLTQETFYRFFKSFSVYSHKGRLANYLFVIAGNLCKDQWRSAQKQQMEELTENIPDPIKDMDAERKTDIRNAVRSLPQEIREVVCCHYILGMKLREIADAEGISLSLVKYRLMKGKEMLKNALEKELFLWLMKPRLLAQQS